jgi:GntR family transcriptional regulator
MVLPVRMARDGGIPLYRQIFLALRDEILSGQRGHATMLPTEHELVASYGISRITARRALDELAENGLVERKRRTGTRVTFHAPEAPIEANIDQAVESLIAFGRRTKVDVISFAHEPATSEMATLLGLEAGQTVVRALRIRRLNDMPLGAIESLVPERFAAGLSGDALTTTPLLELIQRSGHAIGGGTQRISATVADPALATLLQVEPRAAVIRIDRLVRDRDGTALLATTAQYRGDRYHLSVDLTGPLRSSTEPV